VNTNFVSNLKKFPFFRTLRHFPSTSDSSDFVRMLPKMFMDIILLPQRPWPVSSGPARVSGDLSGGYMHEDIH
jgi:hypothetical protein